MTTKYHLVLSCLALTLAADLTGHTAASKAALSTVPHHSETLALEQEVLKVSYPLLLAAGSITQEEASHFGFLLHDQDYYERLHSREHAQWAEKRYQLGKGIHVRYVFPGSGADKAGLRSGDTLISVNGGSLQGTALKTMAHISTSSPRQQIHLAVERGAGAVRTFRIKGSPGKVFSVHVSEENALNLFVENEEISITKALLNELEDDNELAILLSYAIADSYVSAGSQDRDTAIDELALYMMTRCDYSGEHAVDLWKRLAGETGQERLSPLAQRFPFDAFRLSNVRGITASIESKRQKGEALIPDKGFPTQ